MDTTNVYWADGDLGTVMQADLATGTPTQLAGNLSMPQSLVIAVPGAGQPNNLYWVEPSAGNVDKEQPGGTVDMQFASGQASPSAVAVPSPVANSSGAIFWFTASKNTDAGTLPGGLYWFNTSMSIASFSGGEGGKLAVWADTANCFTIVYSTNTGGGTLWADTVLNPYMSSMGCPLTSGSPVSLVVGTSIAGVTLDSTFAYWTTGATGAVAKVPLDGGTPVVIAPNEANPTDVAVDALYLYWLDQGATSGGGAVMKAPLAGGAPTPLATDQVAPRGLVLAPTDVYWISGAKDQGAIKHVTK